MKAILTAGVVGTAIGTVLAIVVQLIAKAADVDFLVESFSGDIEEVSIGQTVFGVVVGGVILTAIALLTGRLGRKGLTLFLAIATVGLVLSFGSPFQQAENTTTAVSLSLMHIAAAMGIVGALARQIRVDLNRA